MPGSGQGPRLRPERAGAGRGTAQGRLSGAAPSPRPTAGAGRGSRGQGGPGRGAPSRGQTDPERPGRPQPAPAPDSPARRRQDPGVAAAPGARRGPASQREAAPRRRLRGPPRSAPPAHFPQEMINSGRGVFPWQPAPAERAHARTHALTLTRGAAHSSDARAQPRRHPGGPSALRPAHVRARPLAHTRVTRDDASCMGSHTRVHTSPTQALISAQTRSHTSSYIHTFPRELTLHHAHPPTLVRNFRTH